MKLVRIACFAVLSLVASACCDEPENGKPSFLPENYPQFGVFRSWINPRLMYIVRDGNGRGRNASVVVFEAIKSGRRLQPLYDTTLVNPVSPAGTLISPDGRFLITRHEFEPNQPRPKNDFVIYDLARGERSMWSLDEVFPKEIFSKLKPHESFPFPYWTLGRENFDVANSAYYPNSPNTCRTHDLPFLKVDLRERTIQSGEAPNTLPSGVLTCPKFADVRWELGGAAEPNWGTQKPLPQLLTLELLENASDAIRSYFPFEKLGHYELDEDNNGYDLQMIEERRD